MQVVESIKSRVSKVAKEVSNAVEEYDIKFRRDIDFAVLATLGAVTVGAEVADDILARGPSSPWRTVGRTVCFAVSTGAGLLADQQIQEMHEGETDYRYFPHPQDY